MLMQAISIVILILFSIGVIIQEIVYKEIKAGKYNKDHV